MSDHTPVPARVFARIPSSPLPRPGDPVTFDDGSTGVVETAKVADDLRDAKCVVILDDVDGGTAS
jgi:hypothetical protein